MQGFQETIAQLIDTNWLQQLMMLGQVAFGGFLGGIVGYEREAANRPAGLRTHAITAAAATLLVLLATVVARHFTVETGPGLMIRVDPLRVVEAVVTGVAFLGAGTIFRHTSSDHVEGLTTAASLLLTAAVGVCVALEQLLLAFGVTLLTLIILRLLRRFNR